MIALLGSMSSYLNLRVLLRRRRTFIGDSFVAMRTSSLKDRGLKKDGISVIGIYLMPTVVGIFYLVNW